MRRGKGREEHAARRLFTLVATSLGMAFGAGTVHAQPRVPLCESLLVVTAVNDGVRGDSESTKRVTRADAQGVRIEYRAAVRDGNTTRRIRSTRFVPRADLAGASAVVLAFTNDQVERYAGATAIGVSAAVLKSLKSDGRATVEVLDPLAPADDLARGVWRPYVQRLELQRLDDRPRTRSVLLNGELTALPVVHAQASQQRGTEFVLLDDEANPLFLRYSIQSTGVGSPLGRLMALVASTSSLEVVRLSHSCEPISQGAQATSAVDRIERGLKTLGRVDLHDILFDTGSDRLREESRPVLVGIAELMRRHPGWSLDILGHTDNVGGDDFNLDLSRRRANTVRQALVSEYGVRPDRLTVGGAGATRPRAPNDTLAGRAQNRRVELSRR